MPPAISRLAATLGTELRVARLLFALVPHLQAAAATPTDFDINFRVTSSVRGSSFPIDSAGKECTLEALESQGVDVAPGAPTSRNVNKTHVFLVLHFFFELFQRFYFFLVFVYSALGVFG